MAACYSPDPAAPLGIGLPFDPHTCERIAEVWARWLEWDPVELWTATARTCAGCGCSTSIAARATSSTSTTARVRWHSGWASAASPHEYEEFDDGHMSVQYRYDVSLPRLAAALAHE